MVIRRCHIYRKSMGLSFWIPLICLLVLCPLILSGYQSAAEPQLRIMWEEYFLSFTQVTLPFFYVLWLISGQKARLQGGEAEVLATTSHGNWSAERRIYLFVYIILCSGVFGLASFYFQSAIKFLLPCVVALIFMHCTCFLIYNFIFAAMPVYMYAFLFCFVVQTSVRGFPSWFIHPSDNPLNHIRTFIPFVLLSIISLLFVNQNYWHNKQRQFSKD